MAVGDLRKIEVRHKHTRHWLWYVTAISFVTGALLAACIRTQTEFRKNIADPTIGTFRPGDLIERLRAARDELKQQRIQMAADREKITRYEDILSKRDGASQALNEELQKSKVLMGLTPLHGPGIVLTLKDSILRNQAKTPEEVEASLLHDYDLQRVVNELRVAGAEAVSINGQRVVERTAIRCVGPVAQVNNVPVTTPFVITAIGDPNVLKGGLTIRNGIIDWLKMLGFPADIAVPEGGVTVPAYQGAVELRFARPVKDDARKEESNQ